VAGVTCVQLYQPAAAAEARFAAALRAAPPAAEPSSQAQSNTKRSDQGEVNNRVSSNPGDTAAAGPNSARDGATSTSPLNRGGAASPTSDRGTSAGDEAPPAASLPAAAKDLIRGILLEDQRARTQELVDAAWQSLE